MGLKSVIETLEGVPEALHTYYAKSDDGKFRLQAEGLVEKSKLDEFRTNNVSLLKQLEGFKDVNVDEYLQLKEEARKIRDKKLIDAGKLDELVEERVQEMRSKLTGERDTESNRAKTLAARLETVLIDNEIAKVAVAAGCVETALDDIIYRGRQVFRLHNDVVTPMDGDKILYSADGSTPLSIKDWLSGLSSKAPHLFKQSQGGGANGGGRQGGATTINKKSELKTAAAKAQFITEHGREAYLDLPT